MGKRKQREPTADEIINSFGDDERALAVYLRENPVAFCRHVCEIIPHPAQEEFLKLPIEDNYHVFLPWPRQTGKSKIVSIYIGHRLFAKKGFRAYIFSGSEDQSKIIWNDVVKYFKTSCLSALVKSEVRGDTLYVGGDKWGSFCELVKIGFEGKLGRGRSTDGNGVIVFEELGVMNAADICRGNLSPITRSGGGEIIISSPSDPGGTLHQIYEYWKSAEKENPRYRVIECDWRETKHCTQQWADDQRKEYEARGALWQYEREIEGKWVAPANVWFSPDDLARCLIPRPEFNPRDEYIAAMDLGGRGRSAFVVVIARYNAALGRVEVVDLLQFYLSQEDHKYYRDTRGATVIEGTNKWGQIEDILIDLRDRYHFSWVGTDPATENSLSQRLANVWKFPIHEIPVGGYSKKLTYYTALQKGIRAQKVVWYSSAISDQLRAFAPQRRENGEWDFPTKNTDIVVCMMMLYQFLGLQEITPFAVVTNKRKSAGKWSLW